MFSVDDRKRIEQAYCAIAIKPDLMQEGSAQTRQKMHATQLILNQRRAPCRRCDSEEPPRVKWLVVLGNVEDPDGLKKI